VITRKAISHVIITVLGLATSAANAKKIEEVKIKGGIAQA
jgi:hypothetical protein